MDARKAYGVETVVGKAVAAKEGAVERLRATASPDEFRALVAELDLRLPSALVDEWLAGVPAEAWPRQRAKLLLAAKLAQGEIQKGTGHERPGGFKGR